MYHVFASLARFVFRLYSLDCSLTGRMEVIFRLASGRPAWTAAATTAAAAAIWLGKAWQAHGSTGDAEMPPPPLSHLPQLLDN